VVKIVCAALAKKIMKILLSRTSSINQSKLGRGWAFVPLSALSNMVHFSQNFCQTALANIYINLIPNH
jgi:hypothetical protein